MQAQFEQASKLHQQGQLAEAEIIYRQILEADENVPAVVARLAVVLAQTKRGREALPLFAQAIDQLPNDIQLIQQAANIAAQLGENVYAERWLGLLINKHPGNNTLQAQYVGVLIAVHKEKKALVLVNSMLKKEPQNAQLLNFKGMCLSRLSEGDKAYKYFEKALRVNPGQVGVVRNLIIHGKGKKQPLLEQIVPQYEKRLTQPGLSPEEKMNIAYVVSMYYEKKDDARRSFEFLKQGNDLNRTSYNYSHSETESLFGLLKSSLTDQFIQACRDLTPHKDSAAPIFILGMPRSGTTLIEQILSSHSRVDAEGELQTLSECFQKETDLVLSDAPDVDRADGLARVFNAYLEQVRAMQSQRGESIPEFFTDKMPYNFMMAGFIAAALPNAKIIHCTRDPLETCFSIYKQNFSGTHAYKNDLVELGGYFKAYEGFMAFLNERFPGQIYEANYERMVADSETEIEKLVAHCGLEMESACLMFHKNKRAVRTASVAQVRQPIYKDAVRASKPFEKELKPLIDILESN